MTWFVRFDVFILSVEFPFLSNGALTFSCKQFFDKIIFFIWFVHKFEGTGDFPTGSGLEIFNIVILPADQMDKIIWGMEIKRGHFSVNWLQTRVEVQKAPMLLDLVVSGKHSRKPPSQAKWRLWHGVPVTNVYPLWDNCSLNTYYWGWYLRKL